MFNDDDCPDFDELSSLDYLYRFDCAFFGGITQLLDELKAEYYWVSYNNASASDDYDKHFILPKNPFTHVSDFK